MTARTCDYPPDDTLSGQPIQDTGDPRLKPERLVRSRPSCPSRKPGDPMIPKLRRSRETPPAAETPPPAALESEEEPVTSPGSPMFRTEATPPAPEDWEAVTMLGTTPIARTEAPPPAEPAPMASPEKLPPPPVLPPRDENPGPTPWDASEVTDLKSVQQLAAETASLFEAQSLLSAAETNYGLARSDAERAHYSAVVGVWQNRLCELKSPTTVLAAEEERAEELPPGALEPQEEELGPEILDAEDAQPAAQSSVENILPPSGPPSSRATGAEIEVKKKLAMYGEKPLVAGDVNEDGRVDEHTGLILPEPEPATPEETEKSRLEALLSAYLISDPENELIKDLWEQSKQSLGRERTDTEISRLFRVRRIQKIESLLTEAAKGGVTIETNILLTAKHQGADIPSQLITRQYLGARTERLFDLIERSNKNPGNELLQGDIGAMASEIRKEMKPLIKTDDGVSSIAKNLEEGVAKYRKETQERYLSDPRGNETMKKKLQEQIDEAKPARLNVAGEDDRPLSELSSPPPSSGDHRKISELFFAQARKKLLDSIEDINLETELEKLESEKRKAKELIGTEEARLQSRFNPLNAKEKLKTEVEIWRLNRLIALIDLKISRLSEPGGGAQITEEDIDPQTDDGDLNPTEPESFNATESVTSITMPPPSVDGPMEENGPAYKQYLPNVAKAKGPSPPEDWDEEGSPVSIGRKGGETTWHKISELSESAAVQKLRELKTRQGGANNPNRTPIEIALESEISILENYLAEHPGEPKPPEEPEPQKPPSRPSRFGRWGRRALALLGLVAQPTEIQQPEETTVPNPPELSGDTTLEQSPRIESQTPQPDFDQEWWERGEVSHARGHNSITAIAAEHALAHPTVFGLPENLSQAEAVDFASRAAVNSGLLNYRLGEKALGMLVDLRVDSNGKPQIDLFDQTHLRINPAEAQEAGLLYRPGSTPASPHERPKFSAAEEAQYALKDNEKWLESASRANEEAQGRTETPQVFSTDTQSLDGYSSDAKQPAEAKAAELWTIDLSNLGRTAWVDQAKELQRKIIGAVPAPSGQLTEDFRAFVRHVQEADLAVTNQDTTSLNMLNSVLRQDMATVINRSTFEANHPNLMTEFNTLKARMEQLGSNASEKTLKHYKEAEEGMERIERRISSGNKFSLGDIEKAVRSTERALNKAIKSSSRDLPDDQPDVDG